jgi:rare lipoprotein A
MRIMKFQRTTLVAACFALAACQSFEPLQARADRSVRVAPAKAANSNTNFAQVGIASWYGKGHQGRKTANGERFNRAADTAAHRSLPFNTIVRVTHIESGKSTRVRINDRGPMIRGRIIDLSDAAATELGIRDDGVAKVRIEVER